MESILEPQKVIEVVCNASRSEISKKKFRIGKTKRLEDLKDAFLAVFELEGFMTEFLFFYKGVQIKSMKDVKEEAPT